MIPHGTTTRYTAYGCRCKKCRKASATQRRKHRQANQEYYKAYERRRWKKRKAVENAKRRGN